MLGDFPKADITIVGSDGNVRSQTRAVLQSKLAVIEDASLVIETGDEIRRTLPNGREEVFSVIDPAFFPAVHGFPDHYQVKIERKGTFPHHPYGCFQ